MGNGPIEWAGGLVQGGWDALANVTNTIGKGVGGIGRTFFPEPQRNTIVSEITQGAGASGLTYPDYSIESPSLWETALWADQEWIGSPYADQYAVTTMNQESKDLASQVSVTKQNPIGDMFADIIGGMRWAGQQVSEIKTLADEITGPWMQPREVIRGIPTAGYPDGTNDQHLNDWSNRGAEVLGAVKAGAEGILNQVKGLFNIGFPQTGGQPAFGISHEIKPSFGLTTGAIIVIALILILIVFGRKK